MKVISYNKKAKFEYELIEKYEAGLILSGSQVKAIKNGKINISDAFVKVKEKELYLNNAHITKYEQDTSKDFIETKVIKILMHKHEIIKLSSKLIEKGLSLIPISIYIKDRYIKIELALSKGKKLFDKREAIKKRIVEKDVQRQKKRIHK